MVAGLGASAVSARPRRAHLRPPAEVVFVAPISAVLVVVSFTSHHAIAPAVAIVAAGGVALAWLSAIGLDARRAAGKPVRARAIAHALACIVAVLALGYIALTRDGLLDMLVETVRFGPDV